ncbi:MAG: class I SAM-dependent methyltransferase [Mycolicibacterium sp.]|nr:class I SAM-dependent methyltransferase [Mycolicibacterium sp.]
MRRALGPDLGAEVTWPISDPPIPEGDLAAIFAEATDVHKWAHYLPIYESALTPFRSRPIRMLEIGVFHGGSLQMWRRYLHPDSVIVGIDIDPATARFDDPARGIHVRVGGQQDVDFLRRVVDELGPFDVILDDGSHLASHIIDTFRYLFPNALADGGLYLVEDLHANYWTGWRDVPTTFADFTRWLTDAMHAHYQSYDSESDFRTDGPERQRSFKVPFATTVLDKIEFHDSIALVYRANGRRVPPRTIYK